MPVVVRLVPVGADGSNSISSSIMLSLANKDNSGGLEPASLLAIQADDNKAGSKCASLVVVARPHRREQRRQIEAG
jgi:hypothetical protein